MAYEQRDLTGSLFKNTRKETESHPDYTGSALIEGVSYFLDAWINTSKDGAKYMSLKLKAKGERIPQPASTAIGTGFDDDSDSVPF